MENDKSTGIDEIPIEFYKIFYDKIEKDLLQIYNYIISRKKPYKNHEQEYNYIITKKRKIKSIKILETNLLALSRLENTIKNTCK